jgi:Uma2 family endonuclease
MCAMPVMPRVGEWTVDDLDDLPDDGLQYELADGVLLVSPAPRPLHQRVIARMHLLLHAAAPPDVEVFFAPLDYRPTSSTSLQPDLLVVRCDDVGELNVTAPLVLAVEVLSPSTRAKDLLLKHGLYQDNGVASYWVVDPLEPSITAWDLRDGTYVEVLRASGDETALLVTPFEVTVVPALLV